MGTFHLIGKSKLNPSFVGHVFIHFSFIPCLHIYFLFDSVQLLSLLVFHFLKHILHMNVELLACSIGVVFVFSGYTWRIPRKTVSGVCWCFGRRNDYSTDYTATQVRISFKVINKGSKNFLFACLEYSKLGGTFGKTIDVARHRHSTAQLHTSLGVNSFLHAWARCNDYHIRLYV